MAMKMGCEAEGERRRAKRSPPKASEAKPKPRPKVTTLGQTPNAPWGVWGARPPNITIEADR